MDVPLILTSPHSGNYYPEFYKDNLLTPLNLCHSIEDMYVNEFIEDFAQDIDVHLSKYSRAVIDLNRNIMELDRDLICNEIKFDTFETLKVKSGIGLIPTQTLEGKINFKNKFTYQQFKFLKEDVYHKWHNLLNESINNKLSMFDRVFIIDFHSMPSQNNDSCLSDFILGNINGLSCRESEIDFISNEIRKFGYTVDLNNPYSGGYITKNYYDKTRNIETLQIEINKKLYMNEMDFAKTSNFYLLKGNIKEIIKNFIQHMKSDIGINIAAE